MLRYVLRNLRCFVTGCTPIAGISRDGVWCCRRCYGLNINNRRIAVRR